MSIHAVNRVQCRLAWDGSDPQRAIPSARSPARDPQRAIPPPSASIPPAPLVFSHLDQANGPVHFADAVDVLYIVRAEVTPGKD
ncbi:uncharacterized protein BXZ73DRAFT_108122 [Epithele typhae]|uniref:uncharacterized protein n=1 Tax=Epithele typhae TaxID=378194 RepID=UPI0020083803|nr:uncharacterized protein BXZ73DRAFT_108122 [Epithele typhae]KAH9911304.1 hypothetical protein BXZ73DRAFT_108122 [Epithele typhae]